MALVHGTGARQRQQPVSLPTPDLRKTPSYNNIARHLELELSPSFGRPDGPQTMNFVSVGDISIFADRVERLYEYGWSAVTNPSAQYHALGQDVHYLHEHVGQLDRVYQSVKTRSTKRIPGGHPFYDASSLNSLLEEPFKTVKECWALLRQRDSFSEERGAIKNIYWNILVEADVAVLHEKIKAHNVKIVALLKPLEIKLLLDIKPLITDNGDQLLSKLASIETKLFSDVSSPGARAALSVQQIQVPQFLADKFEAASKAARPELENGKAFSMHRGINAFLTHYKEDATSARFSGGFLLETPTQSTQDFLRMMKPIWIIQTVRESREYLQASQSGNRLLRCFVESLGQKCLDDFNRYAQAPPLNVCRVRNEPDAVTLSQLGEEAFQIWPKINKSMDIFDISSMDSLKIIFRALLRPTPMSNLNPNHARYKQLVLLKHDNTLVEMITKETSEADASTNSQAKNLDLSTVSLNPIYADPDNQFQASMDMSLNTMGNRGSDDHLSFQSYNDLYLFQEAITGYRAILDLLDVEIMIHQEQTTTWRGRLQLWNAQTVQAERQDEDSPNSSRRPSLVPTSTGTSYDTSPTSQYSSTMSFQTRTSQVTAVTSYMEAPDEVAMGIEATTFEPPKQPVLVLFLRPKTQGPQQPQRLSLMKIPMSQKSVQLDNKNCPCRPQVPKCDCKHSQLAGLSKTFGGRKPLLVQRYHNPETINLALLGAHHDKRAKQAEQKLNFVTFTFDSVRDREVFDAHFREYQRLFARRMDSYEREKRSIRFRRDPGS